MYKKRTQLDWPWILTEVLNNWDDARKEGDHFFSPSVNIKEDENGYTLYLLAPGYDKKDFSIDLENNILSISAEAKMADENSTWVRREWALGAFKRKFTLKDNVDTKKISAKYENGVLQISLLKREIKPTKTEITVI